MTNGEMMVNIVVALFGIVFGAVCVIIYKSRTKFYLQKKNNKKIADFEMQTNPIKQFKE